MKARMIWNEHQQKWLMQKLNKITGEWTFIYDFWDCGNIQLIFNLVDPKCKEEPQYYEMNFKKVTNGTSTD